MYIYIYRYFDSSRILIVSGGILMSVRNFREIMSQAISVGIILVGRLGVVVSVKETFLRIRRQVDIR